MINNNISKGTQDMLNNAHTRHGARVGHGLRGRDVTLSGRAEPRGLGGRRAGFDYYCGDRGC